MEFHSYFFSGKAPEPTKEHLEKQEKIIADSTKTILENINESISTFYPPIDLASPAQPTCDHDYIENKPRTKSDNV